MSSKAAIDRKRKPAAVVSSDAQSKSKARRVSTDASASAVASHQTTEEAPTADDAPNNSMESIGKMIQDLFHSDNAKIDAALDALKQGLINYKKKYENMQAVGGCLALV
jgi:hypothetical protein